MRPTRRLAAPLVLSLVLALGACASGPARPPQAAAPIPVPTTPPKLLVAVSVDQLSADLFGEYRNHFTGGFARLLTGAVFPSAYQAHAATETCPGHSTLLTGTRPARNGIIANNWFDPSIQRADKRIYCSEDERDPASTSRDPVVSAFHLKVPTLGEWLKAATPATRNVAVSAKDRAVVMMGGHQIDAGFWWKGSAFTSFAGKPLAAAVAAQNSAIAALLKTGAPAFTPPAWCAPRDRATAAGKAGTIGTGRFVLDPGKGDQFRGSPRIDAATVAIANGLIDELQLGKGAATDVLSVSLSATDYVGHAVGTEGLEMCIQLAELDQTLGRLFAHLDAAGIDYAVVLSADHGGTDTVERLAEQALPRAVRADPALMPDGLAKTITARTGVTSEGPLLYADGPFGDFYLNRGLTPAARDKALTALVAITRAHPQVAAVFTFEELAKTPLPTGNPQDWSLKDRARASFDPSRSGDVVVLLDRAVSPIPQPVPGFTATHGSAWDYDRRVPLLFWRRGLPGFEQPAPVETVDIAPTLAAMAGLRLPDGTFDGRCLDLDPGAGNTCAGPR